jgi:hypothetical protein
MLVYNPPRIYGFPLYTTILEDLCPIGYESGLNEYLFEVTVNPFKKTINSTSMYDFLSSFTFVINAVILELNDNTFKKSFI